MFTEEKKTEERQAEVNIVVNTGNQDLLEFNFKNLNDFFEKLSWHKEIRDSKVIYISFLGKEKKEDELRKDGITTVADLLKSICGPITEKGNKTIYEALQILRKKGQLA